MDKLAVELKNQDETRKFASEFSKKLKKGDIVELVGDLGSGKTFFARALSESFGADKTSSPSFVIKNEYTGGEFPIHHFDFYRLEDPDIVAEELKENISDQESIIIIEWANSVAGVLPQDRYTIHFEVTGENSRKLHISK